MKVGCLISSSINYFVRINMLISLILLFLTCFYLSASMTSAQTFDININIEKFADPSFNTEFPFAITRDNGNSFEQLGVLSNPGIPSSSFILECEIGTSIEIGEFLPLGWETEGRSCQTNLGRRCAGVPSRMGSNFRGVRCPCSLRDIMITSIDCNFGNLRNAEESCNLNVVVDSDNNNESFTFNISAGEFDQNFILANNESEEFDDLPLSTKYTVTESVPIGYTLENISCTGDAEFTENSNDDSLEITCNSTGNVTCVFVNSIIQKNVPTLSEWGLVFMAAILGIVGFMVIRKRKAIA